MYYYRFTASAPFLGTEQVFYYSYKEKPTERELEYQANELARDNGEGFEYMVFGWDFDLEEAITNGEITEEEYEEEIQNYYADCECSFEEITEEEYNENN